MAARMLLGGWGGGCRGGGGGGVQIYHRPTKPEWTDYII